MSPEAIRSLLHNPDEIRVDEHRIIHKRLCDLLRRASTGYAALREAIESCHRFRDWAEATRMVLEPVRDEIAARELENGAGTVKIQSRLTLDRDSNAEASDSAIAG